MSPSPTVQSPEASTYRRAYTTTAGAFTTPARSYHLYQMSPMEANLSPRPSGGSVGSGHIDTLSHPRVPRTAFHRSRTASNSPSVDGDVPPTALFLLGRERWEGENDDLAHTYTSYHVLGNAQVSLGIGVCAYVRARGVLIDESTCIIMGNH